MVNSPLTRPYFLGETWHWGGPLTSLRMFFLATQVRVVFLQRAIEYNCRDV